MEPSEYDSVAVTEERMSVAPGFTVCAGTETVVLTMRPNRSFSAVATAADTGSEPPGTALATRPAKPDRSGASTVSGEPATTVPRLPSPTMRERVPSCSGSNGVATHSTRARSVTLVRRSAPPASVHDTT